MLKLYIMLIRKAVHSTVKSSTLAPPSSGNVYKNTVADSNIRHYALIWLHKASKQKNILNNFELFFVSVLIINFNNINNLITAWAACYLSFYIKQIE